MKIWGNHRITTFQIIALGFILMILLGTLLLMLPVSSRQQEAARFSDCLFTATSAVCVTGLVVQDTVTHWSAFGQAVILFLIQIGGMGVVTAALTLSFISGRKIGLMQRSVMQEAISAPQVGGIVRLTRFIVLTTLFIELLGALLLMPAFVPELGWKNGVWYAVFHSVSAFCNAGFDLMGVHGAYSSMTAYSQNALVNLALVLLITVGGIGFLVWNDVKEHGFRFRQYRLQSKIALTASGVMILIPFFWLLFTETGTAPVGERILPSLFQSVTLRTAGFNTMDLNNLSGGSQALMILWMLIGGSPGSTAGGMKTITGAILLLTALSIFRRKDHVTCFGRRVGEDAVRNAVAILMMYFLLFFAGGLIISRTEGLPLMNCLFETASALGTVGLSLGITARIGGVSRLILVALMFMGRVGGLLRRKKSLTDRLVSYAPDLDYFIIPYYGTEVYVARKQTEMNRKRLLADIAIFLSSMALSTAIGFLFSHLGFTDANIIMVYLLGLLIVSIFTTHRVYSMVWSVISVLLFDLLFTTPRFTFYAYGTGYPVTFLIMLAAAFIISTLAIRLKQNAGQSAKAAQRMSVVLETDRQLTKAKSREEILSVLADQLTKLLNRSLVIYPAENEKLGDPVFYPAAGDTVPYRTNEEKQAVEWTFSHHKRSGATTDVFSGSDYLYYCMRVQEQAYGVVGIAVHDTPPDASEQSVLASVVGECSLALENARNAREKEETMMLAENERLRANLLRAVSHDLRTPLTSIMGNADSLMSCGETLDKETRNQLYSDIYQDAQWLNGMVENLLSASRMNDGKLSLNMNTELMDDMISEAVDHLSRQLKNHTVRRSRSEELLFVRADARLIVQVLINVLDNAIKYAPEGSEIRISSAAENRRVIVQIADEGPGIPDDQKDRIFDLFYSSGNPTGDSRRGLGIGLNLCQSIIKAHGGTISVSDREPHGSVFEFSLPREEVNLNE